MCQFKRRILYNKHNYDRSWQVNRRNSYGKQSLAERYTPQIIHFWLAVPWLVQQWLAGFNTQCTQTNQLTGGRRVREINSFMFNMASATLSINHVSGVGIDSFLGWVWVSMYYMSGICILPCWVFFLNIFGFTMDFILRSSRWESVRITTQLFTDQRFTDQSPRFVHN